MEGRSKASCPNYWAGTLGAWTMGVLFGRQRLNGAVNMWVKGCGDMDVAFRMSVDSAVVRVLCRHARAHVCCAFYLVRPDDLARAPHRPGDWLLAVCNLAFRPS